MTEEKRCEICGSTYNVCKSSITGQYACNQHRKQILRKGYVYDSRKNKHEDTVSIIDGQAYVNIRDKLGTIVQRGLIDMDDVDFCKKHVWNIARDRITTIIDGKTKIFTSLNNELPRQYVC